jgi:hypothetical protein
MSRPTEDEIRVIAKQGEDLYSMATEVGYNPREHKDAGYVAVALAGYRSGLRDAASFMLHRGEREMAERILGLGGLKIE